MASGFRAPGSVSRAQETAFTPMHQIISTVLIGSAVKANAKPDWCIRATVQQRQFPLLRAHLRFAAHWSRAQPQRQAFRSRTAWMQRFDSAQIRAGCPAQCLGLSWLSPARHAACIWAEWWSCSSHPCVTKQPRSMWSQASVPCVSTWAVRDMAEHCPGASCACSAVTGNQATSQEHMLGDIICRTTEVSNSSGWSAACVSCLQQQGSGSIPQWGAQLCMQLVHACCLAHPSPPAFPASFQADRREALLTGAVEFLPGV